MNKLTRHHRKPRAQGGKGAGNYSYISPKKHAAWHVLFPGDWPPEKLADEINRIYIDPHLRSSIHHNRKHQPVPPRRVGVGELHRAEFRFVLERRC